jgi:hypothetical protein
MSCVVVEIMSSIIQRHMMSILTTTGLDRTNRWFHLCHAEGRGKVATTLFTKVGLLQLNVFAELLPPVQDNGIADSISGLCA